MAVRLTFRWLECAPVQPSGGLLSTVARWQGNKEPLTNCNVDVCAFRRHYKQFNAQSEQGSGIYGEMNRAIQYYWHGNHSMAFSNLSAGQTGEMGEMKFLFN
jgi:hypothetical protein